MEVTEEKRWLTFLSRWMFLLPLPALLLFLSIGLLVNASGNAPIELSFMIAAAENPLGLHLAGLAIILQWGSVAVFFIALARLFRKHFPLKSTFLSAIGVGFFIPMSAGNLHWTASMDLAKRYSIAAGDEQRELLQQIQMTVFQIVESRIDVANLFWGIGILLFFLMTRKVVPMYIHVLYIVSAVIMMVVFFSNLFGFTFPFVLIPIFWLSTLIAHISLGIVFHRKRKEASPFEEATPERNVRYE